MKRIAIIGGGISGLAAAFALEQHRSAGADLEYVVYESSPRLGGVLRTEIVDDCVVEAGPDSFLTEKPWAAELCRTLGLGEQLIGSNDAIRKTYILLNGRLVPLPDGLMFMVPTKLLPTALSPLFSWKTKLRMLRELFTRPTWPADESVAALVTRHYGAEAVDRLADPLLSGIYGGDAASLSARAVMPRLVEMERRHGSLTRAMLAAREKNTQTPDQQPSPLFTSLTGGMETLVKSLVSRLAPSSLLTNTFVLAAVREEESWLVSSASQSSRFDDVILALPAHAAAKVISTASPDLATELSAIPYTSSITIGLGYGRDVRESLPAGFGFLVPRAEGRHILAATFVHNKFAHRAPADRALLRCFIASARAEEVWQLSDEEIVRLVRRDLSEILGITAAPLFSRVYKWKAAMAQYAVGHLERLDHIEHIRRQLPGLALAGNGYRGIGIPDCIRSGTEAAAELLSTRLSP